jgi:hypothetical protein
MFVESRRKAQFITPIPKPRGSATERRPRRNWFLTTARDSRPDSYYKDRELVPGDMLADLSSSAARRGSVTKADKFACRPFMNPECTG